MDRRDEEIKKDRINIDDKKDERIFYLKNKEGAMEKKTSEEWQKLCRIKVFDPDGWDRQNFDYS